jgi:Zn-dependent alcohol dehydrogenases, class III
MDKLITHVEPFNSINDAISIVESGKSARVVLQIKETI